MSTFTNARAEGTRIGPIVLGPAIGQGGEGIVYRAEHDNLGEVAVKEFFPSQMVSRDSAGVAQPTNTAWQPRYRKGVKQFVELGRKLVKLDPHQNIIRFHDVIESEGMACLVMQFVKGHSLAQSIDRGEFDDPERILALADSLSSALEHLHAAQVHHRDIAPDNVLIRESDGRVYLVDFNAAKDLVMEISQSRESLVKAGYSPVEQYWGEGDQAATVDIYAASAVLYHAVSGKKPVESVRRNDHDLLPPISTVAAGRFPPQFLKAIDRGLTVKAEGRPQTAREWRNLLGFGKLSGSGGSAEWDETVHVRPSRWRTMAIIAAGFVLTAASFGAYATGLWPFNADGSSEEAGTDSSAGIEPTGSPAPSQAELDWQAAIDKANPLVPGLWWVGKGSGQLFKSDDFDRALVTPVVHGADPAAAKASRKTYVANTFPFGPAAFEQLSFGSRATFYVDGEALKQSDQTLFQSVSKEFGDVSGKKLTISIAFSECMSPSEPAPAGAVFRSPCLKILDSKGKAIVTKWDFNLRDENGANLVGTMTVGRQNDTDRSAPLMTLSISDPSQIFLPPVFEGACSLKRGQVIILECRLLSDTPTGTTDTTFELRLLKPDQFEGKGLVGGYRPMTNVVMSNPRDANF